jgi:hypothetical protein
MPAVVDFLDVPAHRQRLRTRSNSIALRRSVPGQSSRYWIAGCGPLASVGRRSPSAVSACTRNCSSAISFWPNRSPSTNQWTRVAAFSRVGKKELLLRFASGKPTVLFIASDKLRTPQIADFLRAASEWLAAPHLAESAPATWEAALRVVELRIATKVDSSNRLIVGASRRRSRAYPACGDLDRRLCRERFARRFSASRTAREYCDIYAGLPGQRRAGERVAFWRC